MLLVSVDSERTLFLRLLPRCLKCRHKRMQTWAATLAMLERVSLSIKESKVDQDQKLAASIVEFRDLMRHHQLMATVIPKAS